MRERRAWLIGFVIAIWFAAPRPPLSAQARGQEFANSVVVCSASGVDVLNPLLSPSQLAADLAPLLFTPLLVYDDKGGYAPYLAKSWRWSDDRRTVRFELRNDVRWHDGKLVTAEDVAWTLNLLKVKEYAFQVADELTELEARVSAPGRVEVQFPKPPAAGLEVFIGIPILPQHVLSSVPTAEFTRATYHRDPMGSGPFKFAGRVDRTIRFERNPDFPAALGRPTIDRLVFRVVPEVSAALIDLKTGQADLCLGGSSMLGNPNDRVGLQFQAIPPAGVYAIALNSRSPQLADPRVRRAISASLKRVELAAVVSAAAIPAGTMLPVNSPLLDKSAAQTDDNPTLAGVLLDSAGWRADGTGMRKNAAGEPLRIALVGTPQHVNWLTAVQAQLKKTGITADLKALEPAAYMRMLQSPQERTDAMAIGLVPGRFISPDYYDQFHSEGPRNLASYARADMDSLLNQLRFEQDAGKRKQLYARLQRKVADDVPVVYAVYVPRVVMLSPRVRGFRPGWNGPFFSLKDWSINRQ